MARYTGPVCRLCRREGEKLFLKGERCYSEKCSFAARAYAPGQHGQGRKKNSEYATQFRMKQKAKRFYGVLESQFAKYYEMADRMKGVTGENMMILLERRLDNVIYRMGLATTRLQARQLVSHAQFQVNGRRVNIPSYQVKPGDVICVKESKKSNGYFTAIKESKAPYIVKWVEFDREKLEGKVLALPTREDIDSQIAEHMIVELYSK